MANTLMRILAWSVTHHGSHKGKIKDAPPRAKPPRMSSLGLPVELWEEILTYLDDRDHLINVALVCRFLRSVAQTVLARQEVLVDSPAAALAFCDAATGSTRYSKRVRVLVLRCRFDPEDTIPGRLGSALQVLHNLEALTLEFSRFLYAEKCVRSGLLDARLPALTSLRTSLYPSSQLLAFVAGHPSLTKLSILPCGHSEEFAYGAQIKIPLPSLQKLGYDGTCLRYFSYPHTLQDLYLTSCNAFQLEIIANNIGSHLRRLQFGPVGVTGTRESLTLQYFLQRFPRLRYLQTCFATVDMCNAIGWHCKPTPPIRLNRHHRLTIAWIVSPRLLDTAHVAPAVRELLQQSALHVLRTWYPYVDNIVIGKGSQLCTGVTLSNTRTSLVEKELEDANGGRPNTPWYTYAPLHNA